MITKTLYKDRPAVLVSDSHTEAVFLPEDGAKLVSLKINGQEFLAQNPGTEYKRLGLDTSYVESECSAFDDMFPTIDPCVIGDFAYPDHGEVCRVPFSCCIDNDSVEFSCTAKSVNAIFRKTVCFDNGVLAIKYNIKNNNDFELPYIWAGHIMLLGKEGAYVKTPYSEADKTTPCFGVVPPMGLAHILPPKGACKEYKYYYNESRLPMECTVCYPQSDNEINFAFLGDAVKYLGIWMNPGDLNGMYNLAIEPCTAPFDSPLNSQKQGKGSTLLPNGETEFILKISGGKNGE